jgi:starch synthase
MASRTGGLPEVIDEGLTGWLIPVGDDQQLAARTRELLEDPARARAVGQAARRRAVERFGMTRFLDRLLGTYMESCPEWRAPAVPAADAAAVHH